MKKKLLTLLLTCCCQAAMAQTQVLVLHHADGTTTDVELYTKPVVLFEGDKVLISSSVLNMEYPADNVLRFTYKGEGTGIGVVKSEAKFSSSGDQLIFHGVKSSDKVAVYKTNGTRVPVRLSTLVDGSVMLSLSSISSGVYLLTVNGKTSKFTMP